MNEPEWRTKERKFIPISKLEDSHLLNIYRMLDKQACNIRAATQAYLHPILGPQGDMAQLAADAEMERIWESEIRKELWLAVLKVEITKRELELPARTKPDPIPKFKLVENTNSGHIYRIIKEKR